MNRTPHQMAAIDRLNTSKDLARTLERAMVRGFVLASGHDGVTVGQVRRHIRKGESATSKHLKALEAAGLIEKSHAGGHTCKWGAPGIRAAQQAKPLTASQMRYRDYLLRKGEELPASLKRCEEPFEPVQRIVSAANAPRLMTAAPNSVWSLAA